MTSPVADPVNLYGHSPLVLMTGIFAPRLGWLERASRGLGMSRRQVYSISRGLAEVRPEWLKAMWSYARFRRDELLDPASMLPKPEYRQAWGEFIIAERALRRIMELWWVAHGRPDGVDFSAAPPPLPAARVGPFSHGTTLSFEMMRTLANLR